MAGFLKWEGTVATIPIPNVTGFASPAAHLYANVEPASINLAAHVIGMRCGLSRELAPIVVELAGYRRRA